MGQQIELADQHFNLGLVAARSGEFARAADEFGRAALAFHDYAPTHENLGAAWAELGDHEKAVPAFQTALELNPDNAYTHFQLGVSQLELGKKVEARASLMEAAARDATIYEASFLLAEMLKIEGKHQEALWYLQRVIQACPDHAQAYASLGSSLLSLRSYKAAREAFENALDLDPDHEAVRAQLIHRLASENDWQALEAHRAFIPHLGTDQLPIAPFTLLAHDDDPARHRSRSERFASFLTGAVEAMPPVARPGCRPERLKIGYFSADIRDHATMLLMANMFEMHDRSRFETYAYSYGRDDGRTMRQRAVGAFEHFKDVEGLDAGEIARLARSDGIDIAVDLKGYTEGHRLEIFAHRPAPVQMTYLGYPGTLGTTFIDYLIADPVVIPPQSRRGYSEAVIFMPNSYLVNDQTRKAPGTFLGRSNVGLPEDAFVFCCFNNSYKISPAEFDIWMELLLRTEGSILWLLKSSEESEANLRKEALRRKVDPDRLIFAPKVEMSAHLERIGLADLFVDTFTCNGHTTAYESLWAGLPVLTLPGRSFASRVAASLLQAAELSELVAKDMDDYSRIALDLAQNPEKLAAIREHLNVGRLSLPLFDTARFTRDFERGLDLAYDRYLQGLEPADITV